MQKTLCIALSLVLAGFLSLTPAHPSAAAESGSSEGVADARSADTEDQARLVAETYGHDVVVDGETTPTLLVTAHPNGGFSSEADVVPTRVKRNGEWIPEDTQLVEGPSGWIQPKVAAAPVQFSDGGTSAIAKVTSPDGSSLVESWPYGTLPMPSISDSTATYSEVLPGVDLKVSATEVGMSEVLVIKSPSAQSDPRLTSLHFSVDGATSSLDAGTKTVTASTPDGGVIGSGTPLWWDSSARGASFETSGAAEPKALKVTAPSDSTVALDLGSVVGSPTVQYPVYVDPDWASDFAYLMADWYDDRAFPNQSYFDPPENSVGYGIQNGVGYLSRAFYQFNTSNLAGKVINSSSLGVTQTYANSCDTTLVQAWRYDSTATGFTWNSEPSAWAQLLDQQGDANGGPCAPNPATVGWDVTQGTAYAAAHSQGSLTLGLRVANESNSLTRKHYNWQATLRTLYNTPPGAPSNLKFPYASPGVAKGCGTAANPTILTTNGQNLPMSATITDADMTGPNPVSQPLHAAFYLNDMQSGSPVAVSSYTSPNGTSGGTYNWNFSPGTALVDGDLYRWYARSTDGINVGPYSIECYFRDYINRPEATVNVGFQGGPNIGSSDPVSLTVTAASSRVAGFIYWSRPTGDPGPAPQAALSEFVPNGGAVPCGPQTQVVNSDGTVWGYACNTANATINVPILDTSMSVGVVPYDAAGQYGTVISSASATFSADPNTAFSQNGHAWYLDTSSPAYDPSAPLPAVFSDQNGVHPLGMNVGTDATATADAPGTNPFGLLYTGVGGSPTSSDPIHLSPSSTLAGSMTVSAWVKPADKVGSYTAVSQRGTGSGPTFSLSVEAGIPRFCVHSQLTGSSKQACATASGTAIDPASWTMLTGVWDAANGEVRLLASNSITPIAAVAFTDDTNDPGATSPITLGASVDSAGQVSARWKGELDDVVVLPGVITGAQLKYVYKHSSI